MQTYRLADKKGRVRAPSAFIFQLRKDTGDHGLDCWWDPEIQRFAEHSRDDRLGEDEEEGPRYGAWVIWKRVRCPEVFRLPSPIPGMDFTVWNGQWMWASIYRLDGAYGRPTELGRWVIEALNQSDLIKRGNWRRPDMLNEINEQQVRQQHKETVGVSRDVAKDHLFKAIMRAMKAHLGTPASTREERVAQEAALFRAAERRFNVMLARAKDMRVYAKAEDYLGKGRAA